MLVHAPDGDTYLTASALPHLDGYPDLTAGLLRAWHAHHLLPVVTRGELAAAWRVPAARVADPDQPARAPGPTGPENVYAWSAVVRAETATRQTRRRRGGRPRTAA
jgi:hypothetical protein